MSKRAKGAYAKNTRVPIGNSITEVERILNKYGAKEFQIIRGHDRGGVEFNYEEMPISMIFDYKVDEDEKEKRRLWRVLILHLKSALELDDDRIGGVRPILNYVAIGEGRVMSNAVAESVKKSIELGNAPKVCGFLSDNKINRRVGDD